MAANAARQPTVGREKPDALAPRQRQVMGVAGLQQRLQRTELLTCLDDRLVRLGQVLEVVDQTADPVTGVERFEHVVADEVVEVAEHHHVRARVEVEDLLHEGVDHAGLAAGGVAAGGAAAAR